MNTFVDYVFKLISLRYLTSHLDIFPLQLNDFLFGISQRMVLYIKTVKKGSPETLYTLDTEKKTTTFERLIQEEGSLIKIGYGKV